jgi:hypothetical protein
MEVLNALLAVGVRSRLDGGWGADALLVERTREHEDVDIVVDLRRVDDVITALRLLGVGAQRELPADATGTAISGRPRGGYSSGRLRV